MTSNRKWFIGLVVAILGMIAGWLAIPEVHDWFLRKPGTSASSSGSSETTNADPPIDNSMQVPTENDPDSQPRIPTNYVLAGAVNLEDYCQKEWNGRHAVLRFHDTWGWRCARSHKQLDGNRVGDIYVEMGKVCNLRYGSGAIEHYDNYKDANSWVCYVAG
jgi:hypothetical protein